MPEPLVIVGAGYVGLVTAAVFAEAGHRVWCVDTEESKIELLRTRQECPISETGLAEALTRHASQLHFGLDQRDALRDSGARLVFVAVGTPPLGDGSADMSQIDCVVDRMPAGEDYAVVMKSTVPPGSGLRTLERAASLGKHFAYVSCPEFLREGEALWDLRRPDRVVIGARPGCWAASAVRAVHTQGGHRPTFVCTDITSAEMIKHASNLHLAMRISFANEIANLSEEIGADVLDVLQGVGLDSRIGPRFLQAGVGFGGSCFAKDLKAIRFAAQEHGCELSLPDAVLDVNRRQADRVIEKLGLHLGSLDGRTVALLGLAFKPGTDDLREGPAFVIAAGLRERGAQVRAWDPDKRARASALRHAALKSGAREAIHAGEMAATLEEVFVDAEAVVLVTEWEEFRSIDWTAAKDSMAGGLVIDGRNVLSAELVAAAGLTYEGTGRLSSGVARRGREIESA